MKKLFALALALCFVCIGAAAEGLRAIESGETIALPGGDAPVTFETTIDPDMNDVDTYTLTVGDAVATNETYGLTGALYTAQLGDSVLLFVPAIGFSDWQETFVYAYENGALHCVGDLNALPENMTIDGQVLSTTIRAATVATWWRAADYTLAKDYRNDFEENGAGFTPSKLVELPRYAYPIGMIVTAKLDLPLYESPAFAAIGGEIEAGEEMIISAGNDRDWIYVVGTELRDEYEFASGYLKLDDAVMIDLNGTPTISTDLFDGLFLAG